MSLPVEECHCGLSVCIQTECALLGGLLYKHMAVSHHPCDLCLDHLQSWRSFWGLFFCLNLRPSLLLTVHEKHKVESRDNIPRKQLQKA